MKFLNCVYQSVKNFSVCLLSRKYFSNTVKILCFIVSILIYLLIQSYLVILPIERRSSPVETDDAYTYIIKAAEMKTCFLQNCPALQSLRQQLQVESTNPEIKWLRYREYVRIFSVYHPLHSALLVILNSSGLSWEAAYETVVIIGGIALICVISYLLLVMLGTFPACLAILLLAFMIMPNAGIYYVAPSGLALVVTIIALGYLFTSQKEHSLFILLVTVILIGIHTIGRLYALVLILLNIIQNYKYFLKRSWVYTLSALILIIVSFVLPLVINHPSLSFPPDPPPAGWEGWWGYYNNLIKSIELIKNWVDSFGGEILALSLTLVGIFTIKNDWKLPGILSLGVLFIGLLIASQFHVLPRYPAETFGRFWTCFAVLLTGFFANGVYQLGSTIINLLFKINNSTWKNIRHQNNLLSTTGWKLIISIVILTIMIQVLTNHIIIGQRNIRQTYTRLVERQNTYLYDKQPELIDKNECGDVLYMAEVPMHFYLANGNFNCGAIYYPALANTQIESEFVTNNTKINYGVAWNPTIDATITGGGNPLSLRENDIIEVRYTAGNQPKALYGFFENHGEKTQLFVKKYYLGQTNQDVQEISMEENQAKWILIDSGELTSGLQITVNNSSNSIYLRGIRTNLTQKTNWPWNEGISLLSHSSKTGVTERLIEFNPANLFPGFQVNPTVINDQGDTVLVKLIE